MSNRKSFPIRLYRSSWAIIVYTVLIIAWGAWVRISGSGAGCGEHWPLCHGEAIPTSSDVKTWTEVAHRYSTALFGILVLVQLGAIRKFLPRSNPARFWIWLVLIFTATEALIGKLLVTRGLVNESQELSRIVVMPLHLLNTSLLLFTQVMTAESIAWGERQRQRLSVTQQRWMKALLIFAITLLTTGAIAALGSHLLPSASLREGLAHDFQNSAHLAVRLRLLHPLLGMLIPIGCWLLWAQTDASQGLSTPLFQMYRSAGIAVLLMVGLGVLTLLLLAPTWLKLSHLVMANVLVILGSRCIFHTLRPPARVEQHK